MTHQNRLHALLLVALSLLPVTLWAQDGDEIVDQFNPVLTAVASQSICPEARAGGMGDVGVATDPDVHSQSWNPAKYPFTISRAGMSIDYTPWLRQLTQGINMINAAGYYRIGDYSAVSASVRYFSLGDVITEDASMTIKPYEFAVDAAYSRMLSETFSAAVALRYIYSDLSGHYDDNQEPGSAFAADIALYNQSYLNLGQRECQLGLGLNVSNIGSKISYGDDRSYFLPTKLALGASLMIPVNEYNRFSVAFDVSKLLVPSMPLQRADESDEDFNQRIQDNYYDMSSISGIFKSFGDSEKGFKGELEEIYWSIGAEYTYNDKFTLRAGYRNESDAQGGRKYFTVGAGFRMNVLSIDAGYVIATQSTNPLDRTLRVSLSFDFDGLRDLFGRR
ncbi:MAG: type IX secretion system outer membrane channel protein PorV [Bacteroidaceae bacterium]|nr:type IX secretion system outer membrane channel protein PorV [Bacteroidaceae bacterium]